MEFNGSVNDTHVNEYRLEFNNREDRDEAYEEAMYFMEEHHSFYSVTKGLIVSYAGEVWDDSKALFIVCKDSKYKGFVDYLKRQ